MINVSGQSYNNGIKFIGERYNVSFYDECEKTRIVVKQNIFKETSLLNRILRKIPLVRGFINVICNNHWLLAIIVVDIIMNLITIGEESSLSERATMLLGILSLCTFIIAVSLCLYFMARTFVKMKTTWMYHGAEHKVIETNYKGNEINMQNCRMAPRVSDNCGTMLVSLMIFVGLVLNLVQIIANVQLWGSIELILMITIAYELFRMNRSVVILKPAFKLGYFLQEKCFTKEPTNYQLAKAMVAFSILEGLEKDELTIEDVNEVLGEAEFKSVL